jgi:hypothetical protein
MAVPVSVLIVIVEACAALVPIIAKETASVVDLKRVVTEKDILFTFGMKEGAMDARVALGRLIIWHIRQRGKF